jgi:hypothetical protein
LTSYFKAAAIGLPQPGRKNSVVKYGRKLYVIAVMC